MLERTETQTDDPDSMLVLAAQGGDKEALALLIVRHRPLLLALCRRSLGDSVAAEDAAHEAVLQAMLSLERLRRPERFGAWLAGIGLNICRRWRREQARYGLFWEVVRDGGYALETDDCQAHPEAQAERRDLADRVRRAIGDLPDGQRAAVNLFYASERTYAETAELLGIEIGAVKTRLHKARTTLRQRLHTLWTEEYMAATETKPVEMRVRDVRKETDDKENGKYVVVLEEVDGPGKLLIWIGDSEGVTLAMLIEKAETPRPLTIVFAANLVRNLGGTLQEVRISRLDQQVFYAVATLEGPEGTTSVDARPSDALALALSLGARIWVEREVLTAVGLSAESAPATPEEVQRRYARGASEIVAEAKEEWHKTHSIGAREEPTKS